MATNNLTGNSSSLAPETIMNAKGTFVEVQDQTLLNTHRTGETKTFKNAVSPTSTVVADDQIGKTPNINDIIHLDQSRDHVHELENVVEHINKGNLRDEG